MRNRKKVYALKQQGHINGLREGNEKRKDEKKKHVDNNSKKVKS